ncbi:hypothetical protein F5Y16DRAFT_78918 [Xylariaceae sp. FL0255]|nr:hypothetical protein F5Y16DRAFT_78918 [Xylariaceae sp. FL0255]
MYPPPRPTTFGATNTAQPASNYSSSTGRRNTLHYHNIPSSHVEAQIATLPPPKSQTLAHLAAQAPEATIAARRVSTASSLAGTSEARGLYVGGPIRHTGPAKSDGSIEESKKTSAQMIGYENEGVEFDRRHWETRGDAVLGGATYYDQGWRGTPNHYSNKSSPEVRRTWKTDLSKVREFGQPIPVPRSVPVTAPSEGDEESGNEGGEMLNCVVTPGDMDWVADDDDEGEEGEGEVEDGELFISSPSAASHITPPTPPSSDNEHDDTAGTESLTTDSTISSLGYTDSDEDDDGEPYTGRMGGLNASAGILGAQIRSIARVLNFIARASAAGIDTSSFESLAAVSAEEWEKLKETEKEMSKREVGEKALAMVETLLGLSVEELCVLSERAAGMREELQRLGIDVGESMEVDYIFDGCLSFVF